MTDYRTRIVRTRYGDVLHVERRIDGVWSTQTWYVLPGRD